jgi:putative hemolysin
VTEEEIHAMLAEGTSAGVIESHEHTMVRNVFRLDDRQIGSLMVPRADVVCWTCWSSLRGKPGAHRRVRPRALSRGARRHGPTSWACVNARQWLSRAMRDGDRELGAASRCSTPLYVPETITGMELLDNFRQSGVHMAFVIDEYGEVQGIVTLQDLIEAITGEFQSRDPETPGPCSARTAAGCSTATSRAGAQGPPAAGPCRRKTAVATRRSAA